MKTLFLSLLLVAGAASADSYVYPTLPGTTIRDWSKPAIGINGNEAYQTLPGTTIKDWSKPGYKLEGDNVYPTLPGTTIRDWSKPGYKYGE